MSMFEYRGIVNNIRINDTYDDNLTKVAFQDLRWEAF